MSEPLGTAVLILTTDQGPLDRGLAAAGPKVQRAGAGMQKTMDARLGSMSKSMGKVGSEMSHALTIPILGTAAAAVKAGADFDAAMELIHTQAGASQKSVNLLKGEVIDLAKNSAFGPTDLANALFRLEGAGLRGSNAMKALKASSDLAAVGNANVEDTAKTLAQVWASGIKGAGDFTSIVSEVNTTVGTGDLRLSQLIDALGTGLPGAARLAGLNFKDISGALAVFGDNTNNVSGWAAQLATSLHFLTDPTTKARGALKELGLSQSDLVDDLHKPDGLYVALGQLKDRLERMPGGIQGPKAQNILGDILPGGRGRVLEVLITQLDRYKHKLDEQGASQSKFSDAVKKTQDTTAFQIKKDWASIQADAVQLGQTLGPDFLKIFGGIAGEADKIATAFEKLPPDAKRAIVTGGLITAGIGPALKVLSVFTGGVGKLLQAEQFAEKLLGGKGAASTLGKAAAASEVAEMNVAEMNVAKMTGGGSGGWNNFGEKNAAKTAESDAEKVAAGAGGGAGAVGKLGLSRLAASGTAAAAALAINGFAKANSGTSPVSKLKLFASGADPSQVLHLVGLPDATDIALGAKKDQQARQSAQRVLSDVGKGRIPTGFGATSATSIGSPQTEKQIKQYQLDVDRARTTLDQFLTKNKQVSLTAPAAVRAFSNIAQAAGGIGDIKFQFSDALAAELIKTKKVNSQGVQQIVHAWAGLPAQVRAPAAKSMLDVTQQLEDGGKVASGTTDKLRADIVGSYAQMGNQVVTNVTRMSSKIKSGSRSANTEASAQLGDFAGNVEDAMANSVLTTGTGMQLLVTNLNKALKEMGQKQLSPIQIDTMAARANAIKNAGPNGALRAAGAASGAMLQIGDHGARGRDTIPLSFGGRNYMVGSGEQALVLNRREQAFLNQRTADVGGLPGMFRHPVLSKAHHLAGGGYLGQPMSGGGTLGYGQLEGLWDQAGGAKNMAPLMAAIAEAESRGSTTATNPSGASGLWQILMPSNAGFVPGGEANVFNPLDNAIAAVKILASQGLGAWSTYTSGAYKPFLNGAVPASASGIAGMAAAVAKLTAPGVKGTGVMATLAKSMLAKATGSANAYLGAHSPSATGGGATSGPPGLTTFEGVEMAQWIANELEWATRHGWHGQPTSGYRPGFDPHAPDGSEHALIDYPGGAVDFGGMTGDPAAYATKLALVELAARLDYPGPRLEMPIGFQDDGHLSGTGHAAGGFLAGGGFVPTSKTYQPVILPYEATLQQKFAKATEIMHKLWGVGAPLYHQSGGRMPNVTYAKGIDGLFVGTSGGPGSRPGHRQVFWPDWFINGQGTPGKKDYEPGILQGSGDLLETVLHEWVHEYQKDSVLGPINTQLDTMFPKAASNISGIADEGGAQGFAKMFGPSVIQRALGIKDDAGPESPADLYYPAIQLVKKYLGDDWIRDGQFGYGPTAHEQLKAGGKGRDATIGGKLTANQLRFVTDAKRAGAHKKTPKHRKTRGLKGEGHITPGAGFGMDGPIPFPTKDLDPINSRLSQILAIDGGDQSGINIGGPGTIAGLESQLDWLTNTIWPAMASPNWQDAADPTQFINTPTNPDGSLGTPFIVQPNLDQVVGELETALGMQTGEVTGLQKTLGLAGGMPPLINEAIKARLTVMVKIRERVRANLDAIRKLRAAIAAAKRKIARNKERMKRGVLHLHPKDQKQIAANQAFHTKPYPSLGDQAPYPALSEQPPHANPKSKKALAENAAWAQKAQANAYWSSQKQANNAWQSQHDQQYATWRGENTMDGARVGELQDQVKPLEHENRYLGGSPDAIGKGGELGQIAAQVGAPAGTDPLGIALGTGASSSGLYQLRDTVKGWGTSITATGGDLDVQKLTLSQWAAQLAALGPGASGGVFGPGITSALAAADATVAAQTPAAPNPNDALAGIEATLAANALATNQVYARQYGVLSAAIEALPQFGGSFALGGIVPGVQGEPRYIRAHGKEEVLTATESAQYHAGGGGDTHVHISGKDAWLRNAIQVEIQNASRANGRRVAMNQPGRAGVLRPL